jgi:hypothetical protein
MAEQPRNPLAPYRAGTDAGRRGLLFLLIVVVVIVVVVVVIVVVVVVGGGGSGRCGGAGAGVGAGCGGGCGGSRRYYLYQLYFLQLTLLTYRPRRSSAPLYCYNSS